MDGVRTVSTPAAGGGLTRRHVRAVVNQALSDLRAEDYGAVELGLRGLLQVVDEMQAGGVAPAAAGGEPGEIQWTDEQRAVLEGVLGLRMCKIRAYAGAGKTTLLVGIARILPGRGLYIAYNKAIQLDAQGKFPGNVKVKTGHALAYAAVFASKYKDRKQLGELQLGDVLRFFGWEPSKQNQYWSYLVRQTLRTFMNSADLVPGPQHVSDVARRGMRVALFERVQGQIGESELLEQLEAMCGRLGREAHTLWSAIADEQDSRLPMPHDAYFKLWQLGRPTLPFDFILVDESQDLSAVMLDVLTRQRARLVFVGDQFQEIYAWRGAVNAMNLIDAPEFPLTASFRFGANIAAAANDVLFHLKAPLPVQGLGPNAGAVFQKMPDEETRFTCICRTNAEVLALAVRCALGGKKFSVVGGVNEMAEDALSAYYLSIGEPARVTSSLVGQFPTWLALVEVAKSTRDPILSRLEKFVNEHGRNVPSLIERVRSSALPDEADADVLLTTAHRSKGREWDVVYLMDDFQDGHDEKGVFAPEPAELNLLYVAATRAMRVLVANNALNVCRMHAELGRKVAA